MATVCKSPHTFDFAAQPSADKPPIVEPARGESIDKRKNLPLVGNFGTGKSHLVIALGILACRQGRRVRFVRATERITQRMEARQDRELPRLRTPFAQLDLLILDGLRYVPASQVGSELLFENWTEVLESERITGATLDRLTHRCHIIETGGQSDRFRNAQRCRSKRPIRDSDETKQRRSPGSSAPLATLGRPSRDDSDP